jgi:hypothetical protein
MRQRPEWRRDAEDRTSFLKKSSKKPLDPVARLSGGRT